LLIRDKGASGALLRCAGKTQDSCKVAGQIDGECPTAPRARWPQDDRVDKAANYLAASSRRDGSFSASGNLPADLLAITVAHARMNEHRRQLRCIGEEAFQFGLTGVKHRCGP
jgi:hypothetical protein